MILFIFYWNLSIEIDYYYVSIVLCNINDAISVRYMQSNTPLYILLDFFSFLEVSLKDLIEEVTDLFCSITSTTNQQLAHKKLKNQTSDPLSTRKEVMRKKEKKNGTSIAFSRPRRHFLHIYKSIFLSSFRLTFGSNKNAFLFYIIHIFS